MAKNFSVLEFSGEGAFKVPAGVKFLKINPVQKTSYGRTIAAGSSNSCALSVDRSVWAWGNNANGQLGDGTTASKSSPVAVIGGHSFVEISAGVASSLARKADGSVWAWGFGSSGRLGDGTTAHKSSPIQVVGPNVYFPFMAQYNGLIVPVSPGETIPFSTTNEVPFFKVGFPNLVKDPVNNLVFLVEFFS